MAGTERKSKDDAVLGAPSSLLVALHEAFVFTHGIRNKLCLVRCCISFIFSLALCLDEAFKLEGAYLRPVRSVVRELSLPSFGARSPWVYIGLVVSATLTASAAVSLTVFVISVMRASNRHSLALSRIFDVTHGICITCWLPFMRTLLIFWQCTYWGDMSNRIIDGLQCAGMDQGVAIFAAGCFVTFAVLYLLTSCAHETDPRSFSVGAAPHHGLEWYRRWYVLVYTTLTLTVAYAHPLIIAAAGALMHLLLCAYVVLLQPLYDGGMTDINAGCFAALAWVSLVGVAATLMPERQVYADALGLLVLIGIIPAFVAVALLSRRRAATGRTGRRLPFICMLASCTLPVASPRMCRSLHAHLQLACTRVRVQAHAREWVGG